MIVSGLFTRLLVSVFLMPCCTPRGPPRRPARSVISKTSMAFGLARLRPGLMAMGMVCLALGDFDPVQPVPDGFPHRTPWPMPPLRSCSSPERPSSGVGHGPGAAALTAYYALVVLMLMNGPVVLAHYAEYGTYEGFAEGLAIAAGGLIVYAASARVDAAWPHASRAWPAGVRGLCADIRRRALCLYEPHRSAGPKWLPPTQEFWGYATGVFHIAAGVAILTGVQARSPQFC